MCEYNRFQLTYGNEADPAPYLSLGSFRRRRRIFMPKGREGDHIALNSRGVYIIVRKNGTDLRKSLPTRSIDGLFVVF